MVKKGMKIHSNVRHTHQTSVHLSGTTSLVHRRNVMRNLLVLNMLCLILSFHSRRHFHLFLQPLLADTSASAVSRQCLLRLIQRSPPVTHHLTHRRNQHGDKEEHATSMANQLHMLPTKTHVCRGNVVCIGEYCSSAFFYKPSSGFNWDLSVILLPSHVELRRSGTLNLLCVENTQSECFPSFCLLPAAPTEPS